MLYTSKYYPSLYEGVGDKYAEQEFNIPDEFNNPDVHTENSNLIGEITISYSGTIFKQPTKIYKNPKSLDGFDSFVRAVILENGDLYVADKSRYVIHVDIIGLLIKSGIITGSLKSEDLQDLIDADISIRKSLGVSRVRNKDIFAISEESYLELNNIPYLEAAERKNPQFKFANKNVFVLDRMLKEEQVPKTIKKAEKDLEKDYLHPGLNKKVIGTMTDASGQLVKICAINGDYVRDKDPGLDFDQFVDGGHHYVTSYSGYKKHIPEDEIWVDDVFEMKPNDLKAIVLHEFIERNKMKYKHWSYDKAHEYANKKEMSYRERIKK